VEVNHIFRGAARSRPGPARGREQLVRELQQGVPDAQVSLGLPLPMSISSAGGELQPGAAAELAEAGVPRPVARALDAQGQAVWFDAWAAACRASSWCGRS